MNKGLGIVGFVLSIICLLIVVTGILMTVVSNKNNQEQFEYLDKRVATLETELSAALGYDITDDEVGDTSGVYDTESFTKIKGTDITTVSKGKKVVIWVGRQGCGYCSLYAPTIKSVGKDYGMTIYYIDLAAMYDQTEYEWILTDQESYDAITNLTTIGDEATQVMEKFGSTPMTIIVEDGKVIGGVMGAVDKATLETTLKNAGIKK